MFFVPFAFHFLFELVEGQIDGFRPASDCSTFRLKIIEGQSVFLVVAIGSKDLQNDRQRIEFDVFHLLRLVPLGLSPGDVVSVQQEFSGRSRRARVRAEKRKETNENRAVKNAEETRGVAIIADRRGKTRRKNFQQKRIFPQPNGTDVRLVREDLRAEAIRLPTTRLDRRDQRREIQIDEFEIRQLVEQRSRRRRETFHR